MQGDSFCALPWLSLSVDNQGRSRICCNNDAHYAGPWREEINDMHTVAEAMGTPYHHELRQAQLRGQRHPSCRKCWDIEDLGGRSFRQIWNDVLDTHEPPSHTAARYLDITLGNKCNLTCRQCNEWNSHLWQIDNVRLGRGTDPTLTNTRWFELDPSLRLLESALETATHVNFLGGEPLIVDQQLELLRHCVALGRAGNIELSYNTNMTVIRPGQLELWNQFKRVNLSVSIDAVAQGNDYIRQNSSWSDIVRNLHTIHSSCPSVRMTVHSTFGTYNALTLHELVAWSDSFSCFKGRLPWINVVHSPQLQDCRNLPTAAKQLISQRLQQITQGRSTDSSYSSYQAAINHMLQPTEDQGAWQRFWQYVDQLDQYKHTSIEGSLPELASYRP